MTAPRATVTDLMDSLGMGYAFIVGQILTALHQASTREKREEEVFWLTQALGFVDALRGFSAVPSFPIPIAKLEFLAGLVFPVTYAKVISALWMRPGSPATLRALIETMMKETP